MVKSLSTLFRTKSAVIVCHDCVFGPPHELRDYLLRNNISTLFFVGHRNRFVIDNPVPTSYWELYKKGELIQSGKAMKLDLPEFLGYIKDFIYTHFWIISYVGKIDIFIGAGNLNALSGLILKLFGHVKSNIYYVIDYMPVRFPNKLMNLLYHQIDRLCVQYCNATWNYAIKMIHVRQQRWGKIFQHQFVVPNGVRLLKQSQNKIWNRDLVYIGILEKQQGIQMVLQSMPKLLKKFPDMHFHIIGAGSYRKQLEEFVLALGIKKSVVFYGFVSEPKQADRIIASSGLGMAVYNPSHPYIFYTEPGKVKRYLGCGVPVVMTDVSELGQIVFDEKCGFICSYDVRSVQDIIVKYFSQPVLARRYRQNAARFARKFSWDNIFRKAFQVSYAQ